MNQGKFLFGRDKNEEKKRRPTFPMDSHKTKSLSKMNALKSMSVMLVLLSLCGMPRPWFVAVGGGGMSCYSSCVNGPLRDCQELAGEDNSGNFSRGNGLMVIVLILALMKSGNGAVVMVVEDGSPSSKANIETGAGDAPVKTNCRSGLVRECPSLPLVILNSLLERRNLESLLIILVSVMLVFVWNATVIWGNGVLLFLVSMVLFLFIVESCWRG